MDYKKLYCSIINAGNSNKPVDGYYERHHILPKCLGGDNSDANLVYLTTKAHFIAHHLLYKLNPVNQGAIYAFRMMCLGVGSNKHQRNYRVNSATYHHVKESYSKAAAAAIKGKNNPMYGRIGVLNGILNGDHPASKTVKSIHPVSGEITNYSSLKEAGKAVGLKDPTAITAACKGKLRTSAKLYWEYG